MESSKKLDEPISVEEAREIGVELEKYKNDPIKALQLLKVLERKAITPTILEETKIGKRLKPIIEKPS